MVCKTNAVMKLPDCVTLNLVYTSIPGAPSPTLLFYISDNIELENGEITFNGFIKLNEMEAEDNEGDTDDAWVTMTSMGFNKSLILDEVNHVMLYSFSCQCQDSLFEDFVIKFLCVFVLNK